MLKSLARHIKYAQYVFKHKWFVLKACLQLGVPLWMALLHDWDKFLPNMWLPYARTFYTPDGTKRYNETMEFTTAWMRHMHRNQHHWQYWCRVDGIPIKWKNILIWDRGEAQRIRLMMSLNDQWFEIEDIDRSRITAEEMPDVHRREMLADWKGAGAANGQPDTRGWYLKMKDKMILAPNTRAWIEQQLDAYESDPVAI